MTSAVFVGWQVRKVLKISIDSAKEDNEENVDRKQLSKEFISRRLEIWNETQAHALYLGKESLCISQAFIFLVTRTPLEGCKIHVSI